MREPTCLSSLLHLNSMSNIVKYSMNMFDQYVTKICLNRMMRCDKEHNIHEYITYHLAICIASTVYTLVIEDTHTFTKSSEFVCTCVDNQCTLLHWKSHMGYLYNYNKSVMIPF